MNTEPFKPFVRKSRGYGFWMISFPSCTMRELFTTHHEAFTHAYEIARRQKH